MAKEIKVNGEQSDWYKEAVFILKEEETGVRRPKNLVEYADQILEKNMKLGTVKNVTKQTSTQAKGTVWIDCLFWGSIGLFIIVCMMYFGL